MKEKKQIVILVAVFAAVLIAASVGYRTLSARYRAGQEKAAERVESVEQDASDGASEPDTGTDGEDSSQQSQGEDALKAAPDFALLDSDEKNISLSEHFGKPILLNFWATWCPPCQGEMPHFDTAYQKYSDQVDFMMVSLVDGTSCTVEGSRSYLSDNSYSLPLYFDTTSEGAYAYGVSSIPTTVCITKEGNIFSWQAGAMDETTLGDLLERFLAHPENA